MPKQVFERNHVTLGGSFFASQTHFYIMENKVCRRTRFETEALGNWEIACYLSRRSILGGVVAKKRTINAKNFLYTIFSRKKDQNKFSVVAKS